MTHRAFRVALVLALTTLVAPLASRAEEAAQQGAATTPSVSAPSAAPAGAATMPAPTAPAATSPAPGPADATAPQSSAPEVAAPEVAAPAVTAPPAAPASIAQPEAIAPATPAPSATTAGSAAPASGAPTPATPNAAPSAAAPAPTPTATDTAGPAVAAPASNAAAPATPAATEPATATPATAEPATAEPAVAKPDAATADAAAPGASMLNDVARFLAGLPPPPESPLAPLAAERQWQRYARSLDDAFKRVETHQLAKIRIWSARNLPKTRSTLLYFFSGPDFLYANAFFPKVETYVLAGLEPVGTPPDPLKLKGHLPAGLRQIQASMSSILSYSFFRTKDMKKQLQSGYLDGTLPILYVFLARTGNALLDVELVDVDETGAVLKAEGKSTAGTAHGAKIRFKSPDGTAKTLYYFSTNLANDGVAKSGFLTFCQKLTPADAFIKSASYLLHESYFSRVRDFLLENATAIVQDDSGIPLRYFEPKVWDLRPFGRYAGPIRLFAGRHQKAYASLFKVSTPLDFGVGYRWRANESNLLLAIKAAPGAPSPK